MSDYAASESHFLIKIEGIEGYWAQRSGGAVSAETSDAFNGGNPWPTTVVGTKSVSEIVCTRPFDPRKHQPLFDDLLRRVGSFRPTISQQPTMSDFAVVADPTVWIGCVLKTVELPETNAGSSAPAVMKLTFKPGRVK